jgi:hypothetical protein
VGGTCGTHGGRERLRDHWEDLSVGRRIILTWTLGR